MLFLQLKKKKKAKLTCWCYWVVWFFTLLDNNSDLSSCRELISSSATTVDELIIGLSKEDSESLSLQLPCLHTVISARDELHSALQSLSSSSCWSQQEVDRTSSSSSSEKRTENDLFTKERAKAHNAVRNRVVSKLVYSLAPGVANSDSPHWV